MDSLTTKQITIHSHEYEALLDLRDLILRRPIGLRLRDEDLSDDAADLIFVAMNGDTMIGCVMMHPMDQHKERIRLRQMAVLDAWQGKGVGSRLVAVAEQAAWNEGYRAIILHARIEARGFYDKLGYIQEGDIFEEVGIPHLTMQKPAP